MRKYYFDLPLHFCVINNIKTRFAFFRREIQQNCQLHENFQKPQSTAVIQINNGSYSFWYLIVNICSQHPLTWELERHLRASKLIGI
mgnify:FL=1